MYSFMRMGYRSNVWETFRQALGTVSSLIAPKDSLIGDCLLRELSTCRGQEAFLCIVLIMCESTSTCLQ